MIRLEDLPANLRGSIGILTFLLFILSVLLIIRLLWQKRRLAALLMVIPALLLYLPEQLISLYQNYDTLVLLSAFAQKLAFFYVSLPTGLILLLLLAAAVLEGWLFSDISRRERHLINAFSVKEAVDSLPSGILCYLPTGRIILSNLLMENFCLQATGEVAVNGNDLMQKLEQGSLSGDCSMRLIGSQRTVSLPDGRTFEVVTTEGKFEKRKVCITLLHDITEETKKVKELWEAGERQRQINRELSEKNRSIVGMTAQEETLHAKMRIHNELGALLLQIRKSLSGEMEEQEQQKLKGQLRNSIAFLKTEEEPAAEDECSQILSAAEKLGVSVELSGELPQEEKARHICACGLHECLTNTLRHAHGDHLYVRLDDEKAVFTNNGDPPPGEVAERGGLKSLRIMIEQAGGRMLIRSKPAFELTIVL